MRGVPWRLWDGVVLCACAITALALADGAYLVWRDGLLSVRATLGGVAVGWWTAMAAAVPLIVVVSTLLLLAGKSPHRSPLAWLVSSFNGTADGSPSGPALVLARFVCLLVFVAAMVPVTAQLSRRIVQEHYVALAVALVAGGLVVLLALAYGFLGRVFEHIVSRARSIPGLGWPFQSGARLAAVLAGLAAVAAALVLSRFWKGVFSYAPWPTMVRVGAALCVAPCLYQFWRTRRDDRRWRVGSALGLALSFLALAPVALRLSPNAWDLKRAAFSDSLGGGLGRAVFRRALDADSDGLLTVFGDGDCEPKVKAVHYGATEIPENGIDEDCDGQDLRAAGFQLFGKWNHPLPDGFVDKPNIVLVTVDALAANRVSRKRNGRSLTPTLDRMLKRGVYFEHAFSQGPSTRLSLPSMFTSKWDSMIERKKARRPPYPLGKREKQLQDLLAAHGYQTVAVQSDNIVGPPRWPTMTRGFSKLEKGAARSKKKHNAKEVTDAALKVWRTPRQRPLYMWVHYFDPHSPYHQPPGTEVYGKAVEDIYDAEVSFVDAHIAPLLDALVADPSTVVVVTSDHGTVFHPKPKTRKKRYGYDVYTATLHVPLLIVGPGIAPQRVSEVVTTLDVVPTVANLVGLRPTRRFVGDSLVPLLFGLGEASTRLTYHQFYLPERPFRKSGSALAAVAVRDDQHNLIMNRKDGSLEFYDWQNDYYEMNNLARQEAHAEAFMRLKNKLLTFVHLAGPYNGKGYKRHR